MRINILILIEPKLVSKLNIFISTCITIFIGKIFSVVHVILIMVHDSTVNYLYEQFSKVLVTLQVAKQINMKII